MFTSDSRGWYALPGTARDVAAAGNTGWIIGTTPVPGGYTIHRFDGVDFDRVPGGATAITVGPSEQPWIVNSFGEVFRGTPYLDERICPVGTVDVPESATSVGATTLLPGESITVTPNTASLITAFWPAGKSGPEGWNSTAPTCFPLPGARPYSLLDEHGLGMAVRWGDAEDSAEPEPVTRSHLVPHQRQRARERQWEVCRLSEVHL